MSTPVLPVMRRMNGVGNRSCEMHLKKVTKDVLRATVGRAGETLLRPTVKFIIFTRGRTGSNLLVSLMKSHQWIRVHGEIFGEYYLQNAFVRNEINKIGAVRYFDLTTRRMLMERAIGLKCLYYQLESDYAERWNVPSIPTILAVLQERTDLRIIHLKRRNKLATLVSTSLARKKNSYTGGSYGNTKLVLTFQECLEDFLRVEQWENWYDGAFASHPFVEMYYEDLVVSTETEMQRVFKLLNLDATVVYSPMRKQNTRSFTDVIENFLELKARFIDTPYEGFFTDQRST